MGRGRPKKNAVWVRTRIDADAHEWLANSLIEGGFVYERDGVSFPEWGRWLEAHRERGIVIRKNPESTP